MLKLKILALKIVKKCINIYKFKMSLFGRDDTKQAKSLNFIVVPQVESPQKKRCQMLLKPIIMAIINLLNLQDGPDKVFLNYV